MVRSIFRIVRLQNLMIVAGTMYLMRYFVVQPILISRGLELQLADGLFLCLTIAVMLFTAAGYVINDYFDTRTDLINRPEAVVVGRSIPRRVAILLHWLLNAVGVLLAFIVFMGIGRPLLSLVFLTIPGVLWFYSTTYKRQFLVGNILVSALTAMVPLMVLLFEMPLLYAAYWQKLALTPWLFNSVIYWVGGYAIFAFMLSLVREIIKDIEDFEGDSEFGRNTIPVVLGVKHAQLIAGSLLFATIILIAYLFGAYLNFLPNGRFDYFTFLYMLIGLVIPMFALMIIIFRAEHKGHYTRASQIAKLIMLNGLLYAIFFRLLIQ